MDGRLDLWACRAEQGSHISLYSNLDKLIIPSMKQETCLQGGRGTGCRVARKPRITGEGHAGGISRQGEKDLCRKSRNLAALNLADGVCSAKWLRDEEQGET